MRLIAFSLLAALCSLQVTSGEGAKEQDSTSWNEPINFVLHRNGVAGKCGTASAVSIPKQLDEYNLHSETMNKYDIETFLTRAFADSMDDPESCGSLDDPAAPKSLFSFCDMGVDRTPILLDHEQLVRLPGGSLPCRWYTREGLRITSLEQLEEMASSAWSKNMQQHCSQGSEDDQQCTQLDKTEGGSLAQVHLYGVPAGRVFMFAPEYVGEIFELSHLKLSANPDEPPYLKVLSTNPRVFDVVNFFTGEEADDVVKRALAETSPSHKMHRSTTGTTEYSVFNKRTSSNAFDTHGKTAVKLKK